MQLQKRKKSIIIIKRSSIAKIFAALQAGVARVPGLGIRKNPATKSEPGILTIACQLFLKRVTRFTQFKKLMNLLNR